MNSVLLLEQNSMSRESFLARVRQSAAAGRAYRVHLRDDLPAGTGYYGAGADPVGRLAKEILAVGGQAHLVFGRDEARALLARFLEQHSVRSALCWEHPVLERLGVGELLAERGITLLSRATLSGLDQSQQREAMLAADAGISSVSYAVAETGTLALASAAGQERLASLAPPVHIAVVEADQVLPDLFDLFERIAADGGERMASNWALITGPSKTGDIELTLTTGVHGPGTWHVIIVR
ncbi:MAG TPA: lactate utilization protein [Pirellulales bacterium]|nr:lactate utilization protein [Pirellulales bacterium]